MIERFTLQLFFVLLILLPDGVQGQTCSCAGAPLINSQSISSASRGNFLLGLTYEYNEISHLYAGQKQLANRSVKRNTQSSLLELNYGITDRLTISGTATFIQKTRTGLQKASNNQLITRGIGDGLVMLKYVLHQNTIREQYQLAVGGGAKIPFGESSLTNNDGIALNMDMQPGTGAWDGVLWSYFPKLFCRQLRLIFSPIAHSGLPVLPIDLEGMTNMNSAMNGSSMQVWRMIFLPGCLMWG